ncbi:hypothetical protein AVEN_211063-1 [Araneus ventricosus]|uniref:Uncharacterized protein n=1 Tax=Araneus ventricosus TaxID=182803 RepID=A0A4Y2B9V0_ARAVE|nr:hypothetical protein AVEN_211063-1 [Araneus ventricosus]
MLCVKFQNEGFVVKQDEEYADYLIIKSALQIEKRSQCVVVVGEDINLLVIIAASTNSEKIFFLKPRRDKAEVCSSHEHCSTNKGQYFVSSCIHWLRYHICSFQAREEEIYQCSELQQVVNIFRGENACPDDIDEAG